MARHKIRKGTTFMLTGQKWKVVYATESRLHCVAHERRQVTISGRTFEASTSKTMDISPDTPIAALDEILRDFR